MSKLQKLKNFYKKENKRIKKTVYSFLFFTIMLFTVFLPIKSWAIVTAPKPAAILNSASDIKVGETAKRIVQETGIDLMDYLYDENFCGKKAEKDGKAKTNFDNDEYVPITSDIVEKHQQYINNNENWMFEKECIYDRAAILIQNQFLAKFVMDANNAIKSKMFSGNPAFVQNFNSYFQEPANTIVSDIIYNNANIGNICSPYKNITKVALNNWSASKNRTDLDYLIPDASCNLSDDGSDSGNQHQAAFDEATDPAKASWGSMIALIESNPYNTFDKLKRGVELATSIEIENKKRASPEGGLSSLYKCAIDGSSSKVGNRVSSGNSYYVTSIAGEGQNCEFINVAGVIRDAIENVTSIANNTMFDPAGGFSSVVTGVLKARVAYFPQLDGAKGLLGDPGKLYRIIQSGNTKDSSNDGLLAQIGINSDSASLTWEGLANLGFNSLIKWGMKKINEELKPVLEKLVDIDKCLVSVSTIKTNSINQARIINGYMGNEYMNALFTAKAIKENLEKLRAKAQEFSDFVKKKRAEMQAIKDEKDTIIDEAKKGEYMRTLESRLEAITDAIENHPYRNAEKDLKEYIREHVDSDNPDSLKSLLKSCKKVLE